MPDWRVYVRDRLGLLCDARAKEEGVTSELAGHLEDSHAALCEKGMSEEKAFSETCERVGNWTELRMGILSAMQEGTMHDRLRQIWVPGVVTLLSSYVILTLLQRAGTRPLVLHPGEPRGVVFYLPWLFLLPLIGAFGGYLSRRAHGDGWRVYFAASLPSLALGAFFLLFSPLLFILDRQVPMQIKGTSLVASMVGWVLLPGIALCLGVTLQGLRKRQSARR
jgi:hypothetical protein